MTRRRFTVRGASGLLVIAFALAACSTPWTKPAEYDDAHPRWRPSPEQGSFAPAYTKAPALPASLSVENAVEMALATNPTLRAAFDRVEAAKARVALARSAYAPSIDAIARYQNTFESPPLGGTSFSLAGEVNSIALRGTWLLFDGLAREYRLEATKLAVEEDRAREADSRRLLRQAVEATYYEAVGALEDVRIAEADLAFQRDLLDETAKRNAVGDASLSDKLNFEVRVEAADALRVARNSKVETLRFALAELLGLRDGVMPPEVQLVPLGDAPAWALAAPDPEALVADALGRRPDLAAVAVTEERADAEVGIADSEWFPAVSLVGEAGRRRLGNARFSSDDTETSVLLEARWNLFSGGATLASRREALAVKRLARADRERLRNTIVAEIRQSVQAVLNAQQQIGIAKRGLDLTRQTRDLVRKEYDAGNASLVRLNEAQRDFVVAQANLTAQRVNLLTAWTAVQAAAAAGE